MNLVTVVAVALTANNIIHSPLLLSNQISHCHCRISAVDRSYILISSVATDLVGQTFVGLINKIRSQLHRLLSRKLYVYILFVLLHIFLNKFILTYFEPLLISRIGFNREWWCSSHVPQRFVRPYKIPFCHTALVVAPIIRNRLRDIRLLLQGASTCQISRSFDTVSFYRATLLLWQSLSFDATNCFRNANKIVKSA